MQRWQQLAKLADGTRTRAECRQKMGVSDAHMSAIIRAARERGAAPQFAPRSSPGGAMWLQIAEFCKGGEKTRDEVARHFGFSLRQIYNARAVADRHGVAVDFASNRKPRPKFERDLDRSDLRAGGGVAQLLRSLPPEVAEWVVAQVPEGATLADVIRAIVVDQYHDEQDDLQAAALRREVAA